MHVSGKRYNKGRWQRATRKRLLLRPSLLSYSYITIHGTGNAKRSAITTGLRGRSREMPAVIDFERLVVLKYYFCYKKNIAEMKGCLSK